MDDKMIDIQRMAMVRDMLSTFPGETVEALEEFFEKEKDTDLNRWRDPVHTQWVVYPDPDDSIYLFNEISTMGHYIDRGMLTEWESQGIDSAQASIARRYFAAHPEKKPWHEAKPGEVWELTTRGVDDRWNPTAFYVGDREGGAHTIEAAFFPVESDYSVSHLGLKATAITAGRRIWPEGDG